MRSVVIEASLHDAQEQVWRSPARFRVVGCGRRFGKTHLAVLEILYHALHVGGAIAWWVSPTHEQSDIAYRMFLSSVAEKDIYVNRTTKVITFKHNGSRVQFKSADRDKNLRGEGLTFLVVDEAAFIKEDAWFSSLRPALSDRKGAAILIGTFDGTENYFYSEWERGQTDTTGEYKSWRFPTAANPHIDAEEIDAAKRSLPEAQFAQEYLADPMSFVGAVFAGETVQDAIDRGRGKNWEHTLPTFAGLDWGYSGATAFEACQETPFGEVNWIHEQMWTATELNTICAQIVVASKRMGVKRIYADAAGATENATLSSQLRAARLKTSVVPVPFGKYKDAGITTRRYYLEQGKEAIGPQCRTLAKDTKRYRYKAEGKEDVVKESDHSVDAATAFYASRSGALLKRRRD